MQLVLPPRLYLPVSHLSGKNSLHCLLFAKDGDRLRSLAVQRRLANAALTGSRSVGQLTFDEDTSSIHDKEVGAQSNKDVATRMHSNAKL